MGRRSCPGSAVFRSGNSESAAKGKQAHLVAKTTHAGTLRLLHNIKSAGVRN